MQQVYPPPKKKTFVSYLSQQLLELWIRKSTCQTQHFIDCTYMHTVSSNLKLEMK